jgi:hypothetical protein
MLTAEAVVETQYPARYLAQLGGTPARWASTGCTGREPTVAAGRNRR